MLYPLLGFKDAAFPAGLGWHDRIEQGVPRLALWALARAMKVPVQEMAELAGVPQNLLVWRERKELLDRDASACLYRLALALHRLFVVLPSPSVAAAWLKAPRKELGGAVPVRLLLTQPGADMVFSVIAKIQPAQRVLRSEDERTAQRDEEDAPEDDGPSPLA